MNRKFAAVYATVCMLLMAAGFLTVAVFAWQAGVTASIKCIVGLVCGLVLSPILHELGHVSFALIANMDYVYVKFFCFKIYMKNGKKRFGFISPFAHDQTQVLPQKGGNMQKRAILYTLGGLIYGGTFMLIILTGALVCTVVGKPSYLLWGMLPYAAYLFFLNLPPVEYPSGKTDTLVWRGIKRGEPAEKVMISAMEIQGQLFEGKSFSKIDEKWYFDLPQLCEDEPLFAVMLDLRYRYYLEKEEIAEAAKCLNRLAEIQGYLSDEEFEKLGAELTYMHSIRGDIEGAEESGKLCKNYLRSDEATAKRALLAYSKACGKTEAIEPLLAQAKECLKKEKIAGVRKFEEILLSRI